MYPPFYDFFMPRGDQAMAILPIHVYNKLAERARELDDRHQKETERLQSEIDKLKKDKNAEAVRSLEMYTEALLYYIRTALDQPAFSDYNAQVVMEPDRHYGLGFDVRFNKLKVEGPSTFVQNITLQRFSITRSDDNQPKEIHRTCGPRLDDDRNYPYNYQSIPQVAMTLLKIMKTCEDARVLAERAQLKKKPKPKTKPKKRRHEGE